MTDDANRDDREPRARLRAIHPTNLRWILELSHQPAIIGRLTGEVDSPSLRNGTVSRRHFEVHWDEARECHVGHDVGSHNGSRVDGQATGSSTVELRDGSVLQVGDVNVVYEWLPPEARAIAPTLVTRSALFDPGLELPTQPRGPSGSSYDGAGYRHGLHPPLPGAAPASEALRRAVDRVASESTPVLLHGERGTGKERVAREIHRLSGRRGALVVMREPVELVELVERAAAEEGTLFLDDIDELPSDAWPVLQRATSTHVRLIAAVLDPSTLDPELRKLIGSELRVPPLRERRGDLLAWLEQLYTQWIEQRPGDPVETLTLSPEAVERVLLHPWHENLRELDRLVHELASDPDLPRPIPLPRLPAWLLRGGASTPTMPVPGPPAGLEP